MVWKKHTLPQQGFIPKPNGKLISYKIIFITQLDCLLSSSYGSVFLLPLFLEQFLRRLFYYLVRRPSELQLYGGVCQGWEFAHRFSERIARFFKKNERLSDSLKKRVICSWSLIFGEWLERFAHIAHFWWATSANRSHRSPKMREWVNSSSF